MLCTLSLVLLGLRPAVSNYVAVKIATRALNQNLSLEFTEPKVGILNLKAKSIVAGYHRFMLPINCKLEDFIFSAQILPLFSGQLGAQVTAKIYEGQLELTGQATANDIYNAEVNLRQFNLAKHEQLIRLGVESGLLDLKISDLNFINHQLSFDDLTLKLIDFDKTATYIPTWLSGFPIDINLPSLKKLQLEVVASAQDNLISVKKLHMRSNWADVDGQGVLKLTANRQFEIVDFSGQVELKSDGQAVLGPYLPLLSNGQLKAEDRFFNFSKKGIEKP